ncbi:MAG: helix-turn-helix transcriptional regulator [Methylococcales bacterium]|nr:helix-turn-helix transcriptional regulator [Methylococcales bacterium]
MTKILNTVTLGTVIRQERKRQNVTQAELAALAGVGVRFLRELEHGKEGCQLGRTFKVLCTLGISVDTATRGE